MKFIIQKSNKIPFQQAIMPTKDHLIRIDFAHFNPHRNEKVEGFVFDRRHNQIEKIEVKAWFLDDPSDTRTLKCGKKKNH